jgi:hypothetical protein
MWKLRRDENSVVWQVSKIHHRGTEFTEMAQRLEQRLILCAPSVNSVPLW